MVPFHWYQWYPKIDYELQPEIMVHITKRSYMNRLVSRNNIGQVICEILLMVNYHRRNEALLVSPKEYEEWAPEGCTPPSLTVLYPRMITSLKHSKMCYQIPFESKLTLPHIQTWHGRSWISWRVKRHFFHIVRCRLSSWCILRLVRDVSYSAPYLLIIIDF